MPWTRQTVASGGEPIATDNEAHRSPRMLKAITIHWDAVATTNETLTMMLNSSLGDQYDTVIYTLDPSMDGIVDVLLTDINLPISPEDAMRTTYANTDGNVIGIQILYSDWWA